MKTTFKSAARILFLGIALLGCSEGEQRQGHSASKSMPEGSPTASVAAAEAYNRGVKCRETDKARAIEEFSAAIEIDPAFEMAIYNRALTSMELSRDEQTIKDLALLQEMNSTHAQTLEQLMGAMPPLHCHHGHEAIEKKDFKTAIEKFTAALLYAPEDHVILMWRAYAHEQNGDEAEAARDENASREAKARGVPSIVAVDEDDAPKQ